MARGSGGLQHLTGRVGTGSRQNLTRRDPIREF